VKDLRDSFKGWVYIQDLRRKVSMIPSQWIIVENQYNEMGGVINYLLLVW